MRYPEISAGGYTRVDGKVSFFLRVQSLIDGFEEPVTVVDFGAGRGAGDEDPVAARRRLRELRGPGRHVIGVDVDPVVLDNPLVDEAHVIPASGRLPLEDASVDLIVSEFVWEHVADPAGVVAELDRVLRPGGWICALTPNRAGYIALGGRLVPNRLHVRALASLQPDKPAEDTFPTRYRMNSRRDLQRLFPSPRFELFAYTDDAEPYLYAGSSRVLRAALTLAHLAPPPLRSLWFVFVRKSGERVSPGSS